jgi:hypothetical protein
MQNLKALAGLNTLFFLLHLAPSQLTQLKVFNNQTIGDVSAKYPALFTPAGVTFAIWGLIYLGLVLFCIYHLVKAYKEPARHEANVDLQKMGYLFMANNLATGAWTLAWIYEWLVLSVVLIFIQLATLLAIHLRLGIFNKSRSAASKWFTQVPLSLYFGWIIIATVANVSAALVGLGWEGQPLTEPVWTMIMILVATGIVVFVVLARSNPIVGLVGIWAIYGIILKHQALNLPESPQIITVAWVCLTAVSLVVLWAFYKMMKSQHKLQGNATA